MTMDSNEHTFTSIEKLNISVIRVDGGTQARVEVSKGVVADYADQILAGVEFPPVVVFHDGADYWLADGFHRVQAHLAAKSEVIDVDVREGARRDAILFSLGANAAHGLRRSNEDKRKVVETMLRDAEWVQWSDRKIAEICGVSNNFVSDRRKAICPSMTDAPAIRTVERGGKTYQQDTSRIGKAPTAAPSQTLMPTSEPTKCKNLDGPPPEVESLTDADQLVEARDTIAALSAENDGLRDRIALELMEGSEEEKLQASVTIRELREQVRVTRIELDAVKSSRDTYMRENAELKKQVAYWRKQAEKAAKDAA